MGRRGSSEVGGQQQAEGALSLLASPTGLDACDRTFSIDPVEPVIDASSDSPVASHQASLSAHQTILMANPCSAPDNSSACNQSFLYIRSTERSAAAKCVTAIATKSVAVGRNDRHIPSSYSCHIHSLHSCQDHPAGLWSTADGNGVCCSEAAGRAPVTDSGKGHPHPSNCLPAHSAGADFAQLRSAPAAIAPIDPSNCPPARVSLLTSPRDRASEASRSQGEKRAEGPGASGWERSPEDQKANTCQSVQGMNHQAILMANPCSAPDNSSACNQSFLYI